MNRSLLTALSSGLPCAALPIPVECVGEALPTEIRLFKAGENQTAKGTFVFDDQAAADVMAAYLAEAAPGSKRVMFDLEHLSLDDEAKNYDPDARGWGELVVRDGECFATELSWTPDGQTRLVNKTQRFVSPVFLFDPETKRIKSIFNIALTSNPATFQAQPLVAASKGKTPMADSTSTSTPASTSSDSSGGSEPTFADLLKLMGLSDSDTMSKVFDGVKTLQDSLAKVTAAQPPPPTTVEGDPTVDGGAVVATHKELLQLTGQSTSVALLAKVKNWRDRDVREEELRANRAKEAALLEGKERRDLTGELIALGAELPALAYKNPGAAADALELAEPWASMPMETFRSRVALHRTAGRQTGPKPPARDLNTSPSVSSPGQLVALSAKEKALAAHHKVPEDQAALIRQQVDARHPAAGRNQA